MFSYCMNDRDYLDLYAQRREEYLALKARLRDLRRQLKEYLAQKDQDAFHSARFQADILAKDFQRVQDSMWYLEGKVGEIFRTTDRHRTENKMLTSR